MIFVTVGTTQFDDLIQAVDQVAAENNFAEKYVCQIGAGNYVPQYCAYFRYAPSIEQQISKADLVITHGGATTLQLIKAGKRFVAIANTSLSDDHQSLFLRHLGKSAEIIWGRDPAQVGELIKQALIAPQPKILAPSLAEAIITDVYRTQD